MDKILSYDDIKQFRFMGYSIYELIKIINYAKKHGYKNDKNL